VCTANSQHMFRRLHAHPQVVTCIVLYVLFREFIHCELQSNCVWKGHCYKIAKGIKSWLYLGLKLEMELPLLLRWTSARNCDIWRAY
jgi:hypothetical protein